MKLLHLQYFKKVFETQNITQSAKELFISQPALSRAIKHLENELGVPLFYHKGRNIEPTIYAEEFYPYAVKTLETLEEGIKTVSSVNEKIVTSVILYLEVASVSIPNLVRIFLEKHPDIQLSIMQHHLPEEVTDPVLYITSETKPGLTNVPIIEEPVFVAVPKNHPLAKKEKLELEDIQRTPLLMLSKNNAFRHTLDVALEAKNIELSISSTTDDPATLRSIIKQGLAISFFPKISWSYDEKDAFVLKEIADLPLTRTIYLSSTFTKDHPLVKMIAKTMKEFYLG
ncbi:MULTISPECIES: LysR family transcriptional regulator [unclassified Enterococcus]|uniref:LysR family transcriptional regulator n=1 Tax=unclassified Enterococcus TaxID=2608891 RepID=UPI0013EB2B67|nr:MULTISPECIES: LysR family transcriptional regulator [unclassified Enterococcus]